MKMIEIERRFLTRNEDWRSSAVSTHLFHQGYLSTFGENTLRIRIIDNRVGRLTVKLGKSGLSRNEYEYEYEYEIPYDEAVELLSHASGNVIEKTRYRVPDGHYYWEIDVFGGKYAGLVIAEIELLHEDDLLPVPLWLGREITGEKRYSNQSLAARKSNSAKCVMGFHEADDRLSSVVQNR